MATFPGMFDNIPRNILWHSPACLRTFPGIFGDIPRNVWQHSPECLVTFPEMFGDIPRNVWWHSPGCLAIFPGMFEDIPRNVWWHSPQCLATFPGMFGDSPPIPRVPRIPFPVSVFLVLYIAKKGYVYRLGCNSNQQQYFNHCCMNCLKYQLHETSQILPQNKC